MRVNAGLAKGRRLKAPKTDLRPLSDQAKEGLFNLITNLVRDRGGFEEITFLDCFAGSGAVGIEALSRGAKRAVFVEMDRRAVPIIKENLELCGFTAQAHIFALDVLKALKIIAQNNEQFDFIFLGAPYDNPVLESALELLGAGLPLKPNGSIIAEHRKQHVVPKNIGKLSLVNQRIYGDTAFSFYQIKDA